MCKSLVSFARAMVPSFDPERRLFFTISHFSNTPMAEARKAGRFSPASAIPEAASALRAPTSTGRGRSLSHTPRRSESSPRAPGVPLAVFPKPLLPIRVGRCAPGGNAASVTRGGPRSYVGGVVALGLCHRLVRSQSGLRCVPVCESARGLVFDSVRSPDFRSFKPKFAPNLRRFPKVISRVFSLSKVAHGGSNLRVHGEGGVFTVSPPPGSCMRVGHWFLGVNFSSNKRRPLDSSHLWWSTLMGDGNVGPSVPGLPREKEAKTS